jgi:N-methylhydantoinase A/oxoprolinase/acetone carboxylase beta subunit
MGTGSNLKSNGVQNPGSHGNLGNGTLAPENDTRYVIDIDIGGTYTDAIVSHGGGAAYFKTDTTPSDLSQCFEDALKKGAVKMGFSNTGLFLRKILVIRLSTSLSTNTLLERKGARVGLLLTEGHRTAYLDRFHTPRNERHILLPEMVEEVGGHLPDEDIREKAYSLLTRGITAMVVCLDGSDDLPKREDRVKTVIGQYFPKHSIGSVPVLLSSQVSRDEGYFKRINTALLNAYGHAALSRQVSGIEDFLRSEGFAHPLLIVHSNGGSARSAKSTAIQTLSSGAAAGIYGSRRLASFYHKSHVVVADVGGTSTEIGLNQYDRFAYAMPSHVGDLPLDILSPVHSTLGIGGGSIAQINKEGGVCFSFESVGAFPGPACYNLGGTEATLTDAYLILGYFDEDYFLGGRKRIHKHWARKVVQKKIADPLGLNIEEAAFAIKNKAVEIIGNGIRSVISGEDENPSTFSLFAVGGGGGCMGSDLMDHAGLGEVCVFRQGSVFGAYGSSTMDIMHQYKKRIDVVWKKNDAASPQIVRNLNKTILALQRHAEKDMSGEGFSPQEIRFQTELELKPLSAEKTYRLILPSPFLWPESAFFPLSKNMPAEKKIRMTGLVLNAYGDVPHAEPRPQPDVGNRKNLKKGVRRVHVTPGTLKDIPIYSWDGFSPAHLLTGPALIESSETTLWLPEGKTILFDEYGSGIIKRL